MANQLLEPHLWSIEALFNFIYYVPVYQRPYSWDREQVEVLLDDIIEAYKSVDKEEGYYVGNIIIYDKRDKVNGQITRYDIIDGQQRITTFALILLVLYTYSLSIGADEYDLSILKIKQVLWKYLDREYKKEFKAVNLNSIEKKCFSDLFDQCFDDPFNVIDFCNNYKCSSRFDERIVSNFNIILEKIKTDISVDDKNEVLIFSDYILRNSKFIVIEANCNKNKVFSMFESINSKGKKLEDIDLIKTYIFSKIEETYYDRYLEKWGQLIIKTNDNLYDYLYNYIKAFVCFYRQNISVINFKSTSQRKLLDYFRVNNESEALRKLLDDMYDKVDFYNMLSSAESAYDLVKSSKFRFYFKIFTEVSYKHPKALFLRTLIDYKNEKISKDDVTEIICETTSFMVKTLSICGKDSKDVITMYSRIMANIYEMGRVSKDIVINEIATESSNQGIDSTLLKNSLMSMDSYEKNRKVTISLLALYDSTKKNDSGKYTISYDQAYTILNSFSSSLSLDHLLVQTPKLDSADFKYYKDEVSNVLILKEGHDFPKEIESGMDYDIFTTKILNKIGNLRIYYRDKNSSRQNDSIDLPEYSNFHTYSDIEKRENDLLKIIFDECMPPLNIDVSKITKNKNKNTGLPKMDKLIEFGLIHKGDNVYIRLNNPDESVATLIDDKYVNYKGEKLSVNEWGCKVSGWRSINVYAYMAIVGEDETLQMKRERFIEEHNEQIS